MVECFYVRVLRIFLIAMMARVVEILMTIVTVVSLEKEDRTTETVFIEIFVADITASVVNNIKCFDVFFWTAHLMEVRFGETFSLKFHISCMATFGAWNSFKVGPDYVFIYWC